MNAKPDQSVVSFEPKENGKWQDSKEQVEYYSVVTLKKGRRAWAGESKFRQPITARVWMSRSRTASKVYAAIWIHGDNISAGGHGSASGYGYHKASAAISEAIRSAGVKLSKDIAGVGESAIEGALKAIAAHLGYSDVLIVRG